MMQDDKMKEQLLDTLYHGLQDEMNSAYQYIALAGKFGTEEIKHAFLRYAQDELRHADKLLGMIRALGEPIQHIPVVQENQDDLYLEAEIVKDLVLEKYKNVSRVEIVLPDKEIVYNMECNKGMSKEIFWGIIEDVRNKAG